MHIRPLDRSRRAHRLARRFVAPAFVSVAAAAALAVGTGAATADITTDLAAGNAIEMTPQGTPEAAPSVTPVYQGLSTQCTANYCSQYDKRGRYVCNQADRPLGGGSAAAYDWLPNTICDIQVTIANALP
ncbi:hypothetical protein [Nocardia mexicana]|uniref:Secreted protein n=1 Tax=Nocardia mexicana TaxID=279262 RepID=A0A370GGM4_9NOCA|nr:hypothetical protein [Nocardia mexicana]RDI42945.1 hypothetical protein DFR68_12379 [Nocardia mexicana]